MESSCFNSVSIRSFAFSDLHHRRSLTFKSNCRSGLAVTFVRTAVGKRSIWNHDRLIIYRCQLCIEDLDDFYRSFCSIIGNNDVSLQTVSKAGSVRLPQVRKTPLQRETDCHTSGCDQRRNRGCLNSKICCDHKQKQCIQTKFQNDSTNWITPVSAFARCMECFIIFWIHGSPLFR